MIDENDLYTIDDEETKTIIFFCVLLFYDFLFVLILLKEIF